MGRIKKSSLVLHPIGYMALIYGTIAPSRPGIHLVNWLNSQLSSSPENQEAAERVGGVIKRMHEAALRQTKNVVPSLTQTRLRESKGVAMLQNVAPFYRFEFDLYPPSRVGKWWLFLKISFSSSKDGDQVCATLSQGQRMELEALDTVVDLAIAGRLGTIRQCNVPGCREWFITKDDPRVLCCPVHSSDDLRKGTPERKEQLRRAAKKAREEEKKAEERALECARMVLEEGRKKKSDKPPSHRAQKS
jgi:hypothetical protein